MSCRMVRPGLPDLYLYNDTIGVLGLGRKPKFAKKAKLDFGPF